MPKSLRTFPGDFQPLTIITGDRREVPPKSKGDVLAYSISNVDVMYLCHIGVKPLEGIRDSAMIVSDKQFVIDADEDLRKRFGSTNLLVVGSPAVNLLSRRINDLCPFRFSITDETKRELQEQNHFIEELVHDEDDLFIYHQCLEGILDIDAILTHFVDSDPTIVELREKAQIIVPEFKKTAICRDLNTYPRPIRYLMHKLDRPGIYDALAGISRGETIGPFRDYGLISIISNPFDESNAYHLIYVGGVHGPGTALGLRLLSMQNAFSSHPFGGVYEVNIDRFATFFDKFQKSKSRWETHRYSEDDYHQEQLESKTVRMFLSTPAGKMDNKQKAFNEKVINVLVEIYKSKNINLEILEPYTFPYGGHHDFWQVILDYEKNCDLIVHDITNAARGVMVELGFSLGAKRQYFLVWNTAKQVATSWDDMDVPSLFPVTHVEQLDINDDRSLRKKLRTLIVERALQNERFFDCASCEELASKKRRKSVAYIYISEPELGKYLHKELAERKIQQVVEEDSDKELRVCRICQVLHRSDYALIQVGENDPNSFVVLGMSKAIGVKTLPLTLDTYKQNEFAWARETEKFHIENMNETLPGVLAKFFAY